MAQGMTIEALVIARGDEIRPLANDMTVDALSREQRRMELFLLASLLGMANKTKIALTDMQWHGLGQAIIAFSKELAKSGEDHFSAKFHLYALQLVQTANGFDVA